jgi:hypothetical protein
MPDKDAVRPSAEMARREIRCKQQGNRPRVTKGERGRHAPSEFKIPVWLRQPVAIFVQELFKNNRPTSEQLLLRRLTTDPRMKVVWSELLKRRRSDYKSSNTFKYPATARMDWNPISREQLRRAQTLRGMSGTDNERQAHKIEMNVKLQWVAETAMFGSKLRPIQELALVAFFDQAFEFARADSRPAPRAAAQKKRAHYLEMASQIRDDAAPLDWRGQALIDAAFAYEELADKAAPPPGHPLHVQRQRRNDERHTAFVLQLVDASRTISGHSLYGTVAIVANVAFECDDWTDERVRKVTKRTRP